MNLTKIQNTYLNNYKESKLVQKCEYILITPQLANEFLTKNTNNYRILSLKEARNISQDIKTGDWDQNGSVIRFDENGTLLDGQTRLDAISKSGYAVASWVIWNVPKRSERSIGTDRKRTNSDHLKNLGEKYPKVLSATLSNLFYYINENKFDKSSSPTNIQRDKILENYPDIKDSVSMFCSRKRQGVIILSQSVAAFCHFVLKRKSPESAEDFLLKLMGGSNLFPTDPILILRNHILDVKTKGGYLTTKTSICLVFRTWNFWRENKKMSKKKLLKDNLIPNPI